MPLHKRRKFQRPGMPEFVVLVLMLVTVAAAMMWWHTYTSRGWSQTGGRVVSAKLMPTHYNAQDALGKVEVKYSYSVDGTEFERSWVGTWPKVIDLSQLPPEVVDALENMNDADNIKLKNTLIELPRTTGTPVTVHYDPEDPYESVILDAGIDDHLIYGILFVLTICASVLYCTRIYPAWRLR